MRRVRFCESLLAVILFIADLGKALIACYFIHTQTSKDQLKCSAAVIFSKMLTQDGESSDVGDGANNTNDASLCLRI